MKEILNRLKSPVVLTVIIGGLGIMLEAIEKLQPKTFLGVAIIVISYIGSIFAALNNPVDKNNF